MPPWRGWAEATLKNGAAWLGIDVDACAASVTVTVEVLTLPVDGLNPTATTRVLLLSGGGRVTASLRHGLWNELPQPLRAFR